VWCNSSESDPKLEISAKFRERKPGVDLESGSAGLAVPMIGRANQQQQAGGS